MGPGLETLQFGGGKGGLLKGRYAINGPVITFTSTSSEGKVDYEATWQGESLVVASHSHINGYRAINEYSFVKPANWE
jgi:hypothetical protein